MHLLLRLHSGRFGIDRELAVFDGAWERDCGKTQELHGHGGDRVGRHRCCLHRIFAGKVPCVCGEWRAVRRVLFASFIYWGIFLHHQILSGKRMASDDIFGSRGVYVPFWHHGFF